MPLVPGVRLGAYEIGSLIGAGGMGEVYRARDVRLGRDVAIKVLPAGLRHRRATASTVSNRKRALRPRSITPTSSPSLISVSMRVLRTSWRSCSRARPCASGSVDGTAAGAQSRRIRDSDRAAVSRPRTRKASCTAISSRKTSSSPRDGRVKILDFGLAKLIQDESGPRRSVCSRPHHQIRCPASCSGQSGYMSPEQVRGLPADHRADVFACGVVFYEMLSGSRAFRGDTAMDAMTAILREHPADLPFAERRIPATLGRIVERCIEKNPGGALSIRARCGVCAGGAIDTFGPWNPATGNR